MSVTIIDNKDAIDIIGNAQCEALPVRKNFFDVFGTTGCLLNCESKRTLEQNLRDSKCDVYSKTDNKGMRLAGKELLTQYHKLDQKWFIASEIIASAAQGCASCSVLKQIMQHSFSRDEEGLSSEYEYLVCRNFELRRRSVGEQESLEIVQLFQPRGLSVLFERIYMSNFLCGKDVSIARLRQWMDECLNSHKNCLKNTVVHDNSSGPARLLNLSLIQRGNESGIKLIETIPGSSYRYACLSHRWDTAIKHHQTTKWNILKFLDFLSLKELPANFRDAVSIARDLTIQYLWIDSLCIIQHSDNDDDLRKELAKMGSIYQNAYLTIAATSSPDSSEGCFIKDKWPDICFSVSNTNGAHLIGARVLDKKGHLKLTNDVHDHYPLLSRAWVWQERLLSPRLLQCNYGEFTFECLESSYCECNSTLAPHPKIVPKWFRHPNSAYRRRFLVQDVRSNQKPEAWKHHALEYWKTIVESYVQLELSHPSDVLPAIAGCAEALAHYLKFNYVAGMWKETLPTDLLWCVIPQKQGVVSKPRPKDSTAPSWSWASVSMNQTITHIPWHRSISWLTSDALLRNAIKEVCCEPVAAINPFGKLKNAYLKLEAMLYPWYLRSFCQTVERELKRPRRKKDLYIKRLNNSIKCTTGIQELVVDNIEGIAVELHLDVRLRGEGLVMEAFSHCVSNPPRRCWLSQIYLLHALHKKNPEESFDVFLVLMRASPADGKPNCYRRIGLMTITNKEADMRTWEEMIHGQVEPQQEEFWLF